MQSFDLGHLEILEVLLDEQSLTRAARRLHVSPSALSRTLGKMRAALGDDLLAPAGRSLALTKRGAELRLALKTLNMQARALLVPQRPCDPRAIQRTFRLRCSDYTTAVIGTRLIRAVHHHAPGVTLSFVQQGKEDVEALRKGVVNFDIGPLGIEHAELVSTPLFQDVFVCAYPARAKLKEISLDAFCAWSHIIASRRAKTTVLIDDILAGLGRRRHILATVGTFQEALLLAARSNAMTATPAGLVRLLQGSLQLASAPLPFATPPVQISLTWHVRDKDDAEHRWLRELIQSTVSKSTQ